MFAQKMGKSLEIIIITIHSIHTMNICSQLYGNPSKSIQDILVRTIDCKKNMDVVTMMMMMMFEASSLAI